MEVIACHPIQVLNPRPARIAMIARGSLAWPPERMANATNAVLPETPANKIVPSKANNGSENSLPKSQPQKCSPLLPRAFYPPGKKADCRTCTIMRRNKVHNLAASAACLRMCECWLGRMCGGTVLLRAYPKQSSRSGWALIGPISAVLRVGLGTRRSSPSGIQQWRSGLMSRAC
jgi:hypothetical protein